MIQTHKLQSVVYKAFCDENRLQIIDLLTTGQRCACELLDQLHISQSTLSHHMQILIDSGIVTSRRSGKWTYYALDEAGCTVAVTNLNRLLTKKESTTDRCACEVTNHEILGH